jgi:predicted negative regulator of RcsB-dependent stress response
VAYETEDEQLEAMKKWWKENAVSVVIGIVVGITLLGGWRWWQGYTDQQGQLASSLYEQVLFSLEEKKRKPAGDLTNQLLSNHSGSSYAILAVLNMARQDLDDGDIDSSHARLQWVIDQEGDFGELTQIARLRKARLFLSQEKLAEAKALLEDMSVAKFKGVYAELRGDIAVAQGQIDVAISAYIEALESPDLSPQHREWVQMKRDDLGPKKEVPISPPLSTNGHSSTTQESVLITNIPALGNPSTAQEIVLTPIPVQGNPSTAQEIVLTPIPVQGNPSTAQEIVLTPIPVQGNPSTAQEIVLTPIPVQGNPSTTQESVLSTPIPAQGNPSTAQENILSVPATESME